MNELEDKLTQALTLYGRPLTPSEARVCAKVVEKHYQDLADRVADTVSIVWKAAVEHLRRQLGRVHLQAQVDLEDLRRQQHALVTFLSDLDRCPHGRHEGDMCSGLRGCNGPSKGNPCIREARAAGYNVHGVPYMMPPRGERHRIRAWMLEDPDE